MSTYPLSLEANWQDAENVTLAASLADWLKEPHSLTKRLKSQCQHFAVEVISEQVLDAKQYRSELFDPQSAHVLVREVILFCDNQPMVYAQSWIPEQRGTHPSVDLSHLGDRPLGEVIFQDPQLCREQLEVADFTANDDLTRLCKSFNLPTQPMWGRRSRFNLTEQHIMVCEVFLPGAYPYL
ncbi:chorismate--pyruvate lyase family protein [Pseudoalteromonas sp. SSDWG2]|uniref:chorismate--pyruvate lyase family protein n=1 Tax=Pseudoalteromonas sp. SSDWG2 TaxID=3139391 RepID=UPI003BA8AD77